MTLADYLESTVSGSVAVVKTDGNGVLQAVRKRVNHTDTETDVVKKKRVRVAEVRPSIVYGC